MEASKFFSEIGLQKPEVTVLREPVEDGEPIYYFFVDGELRRDVGVVREETSEDNFTYNFFNDYKLYAGADVLVVDDRAYLEWIGQDGDYEPQDLLKILPSFVYAVVKNDFACNIIDESTSRL